MRQLTATDAAFLNLEQPRTPMHLTSLLVFDCSDAPGGPASFERIRSTIEERGALVASYRQRLAKVPFDLDYPWWYDGGSFDSGHHIRRATLPKPGDWRRLCDLTEELAAKALDLTRPLWEVTVVDGLDHVEGVAPGSFALVLKTHHAAIDGISGMELLATLLTAEPEHHPPEHHPPELPQPGSTDGEQRPTPGRLARLALRSATRHQARLATTLAAGLADVPGLAREVLPELVRGEGRQLRAPSTRFGGKVTAERAFDGIVIEFDDVSAIRRLIDGATVNDVILSVVGGALRRYLIAHDELPDASLLCAVPVSLRSDGDTTPGNQVSAMPVSLHTDVTHAAARVEAIHISALAAKRVSDAVTTSRFAVVADHVPAAVAMAGTRLVARLGLSQQARHLFNTTVTNVPGPRAPSYTCGSRLIAHYGLGPVVDGSGLFHSVMGVERRLFLSVTACRAMLPDPAFYRTCLAESLAEHIAAQRNGV